MLSRRKVAAHDVESRGEGVEDEVVHFCTRLFAWLFSFSYKRVNV